MTTRCASTATRSALAALVLLVAACGGGSSRHAETARDPAPVAVSAKCGDTSGARVRPLWLHAHDGQRLYAIRGGSGTTGVVLVPESPPGDVCGWLPYLATLEHAGLRVLALDYRGTGDSSLGGGRAAFAYGDDLAAAVGRLRADGAARVIVVGASFGGVAAMQYGPRLHVDAVVSLSGETRLPEFHVDAIRAIPRLRVPLLIVGTRDDSYLPVADARRLLRHAGSAEKQTMFFPGSWHGWDIVEVAPFAAKARALILAWIRAHVA